MYNNPHQFEPLVPSSIPAAITDKAAQIVRDATRLTGMVHPTSRKTIRERVRSMNSYYSNRIEGQGNTRRFTPGWRNNTEPQKAPALSFLANFVKTMYKSVDTRRPLPHRCPAL